MVEYAVFILRTSPETARQWPCFIGPTGAGKTARARQIADALCMRLVTLLPATCLPEDILGLPRVEGGRTVWSLPDWAATAQSEPCLIFIDEADKARTETVGALLTLMSGLSVRDVSLHPATKIIVAMQPVDRAEFLSTETGRAFAARLVFLPVSYDRARIASMFGIDADALTAAAGSEPAPELPVLPVISDRQLEAAMTFCNAAPDAETRYRAVYGIAGERTDALLAAWESAAQTAVITPLQVREAILDDPSIAGTMSVPELVAYAPTFWVEGCPRSFRLVMEEIAKRGTVDDWSTAVRSVPLACRAELEALGGEAEIFRAVLDRDDDDVADELFRELDELISVMESFHA